MKSSRTFAFEEKYFLVGISAGKSGRRRHLHSLVSRIAKMMVTTKQRTISMILMMIRRDILPLKSDSVIIIHVLCQRFSRLFYPQKREIVAKALTASSDDFFKLYDVTVFRLLTYRTVHTYWWCWAPRWESERWCWDSWWSFSYTRPSPGRRAWSWVWMRRSTERWRHYIFRCATIRRFSSIKLKWKNTSINIFENGNRKSFWVWNK